MDAAINLVKTGSPRTPETRTWSAVDKSRPEVTDRFTPAEFGSSHRQLLEETLAPLAKSVGAKALGDKLSDAIRTQQRTDKNVEILADNLKEIQETRRGAIPLKDAYSIDQTLAEEAAAQAAKSTAGVLTSESARFLPQPLRADYERLSGLTISDQPGVAVDGVSVKQDGANVNVSIEFEKALAGVTSKTAVLAVTDTLTVSASRLDGVQDPSLPPYWITIAPREGKLPADTQLRDENNGWRSFVDPNQAQLVRTGGEKVDLLKGGNATEPFQTYSFQLDKVNNYGTPQKAPSAASAAVRTAWEARFSDPDGGFDLAAGLKDGSLEPKTLAEVRELPGIKVLLSAIRETTGQSVTKLVKNDLLEFAVDPKSNSLAVLRREDGESEQALSVVDLNKGRWVGTWSVSDDGTKQWNER